MPTQKIPAPLCQSKLKTVDLRWLQTLVGLISMNNIYIIIF